MGRTVVPPPKNDLLFHNNKNRTTIVAKLHLVVEADEAAGADKIFLAQT